MKRIISLMLCLVLSFSLTACNGSSGSESSKRSKHKKALSKITMASGYCNGYMFVQFNNSQEETHCIDKKGEILFSLEGNYQCIIGFYNGIAAVKEVDNQEIYLCDTSGNLTSAEDVGGTVFMLDSSEIIVKMFKDGYIPVKQTTTSHTGSTDKLAIIDPSFNLVMNYNEKFYNDFFVNGRSSLGLSWYGYVEVGEYYDGYIFDRSYYGGGMCLDLRTGTTSDNLYAMYNNMNISHESDMWRTEQERYYKRFYIYDIRDNRESGDHDEVVDLDIYFDTMNFPCGYFEGGYCPVTLEVEDSNTGTEYFFGIIKEEQENWRDIFCFKPVNLNCTSEPQIYRSNENYLLIIKRYENEMYETKYLIYNTKGEVIEQQINIGQIIPELFSDDVLILYDDGVYTPLTLDFEPLF